MNFPISIRSAKSKAQRLYRLVKELQGVSGNPLQRQDDALELSRIIYFLDEAEQSGLFDQVILTTDEMKLLSTDLRDLTKEINTEKEWSAAR